MVKFVPIFAALVILTGVIEQAFAQSDAVERGQYIFTASGCAGCHTDTKGKGPFLAGGHALKTPFGTYYGPNITPDKTHGIGNWSDEDFIRALREGKAPNGSHYFPVFPYTSFTKMTGQDTIKCLIDYYRQNRNLKKFGIFSEDEIDILQRKSFP